MFSWNECSDFLFATDVGQGAICVRMNTDNSSNTTDTADVVLKIDNQSDLLALLNDLHTFQGVYIIIIKTRNQSTLTE